MHKETTTLFVVVVVLFNTLRRGDVYVKDRKVKEKEVQTIFCCYVSVSVFVHIYSAIKRASY